MLGMAKTGVDMDSETSRVGPDLLGGAHEEPIIGSQAEQKPHSV